MNTKEIENAIELLTNEDEFSTGQLEFFIEVIQSLQQENERLKEEVTHWKWETLKESNLDKPLTGDYVRTEARIKELEELQLHIVDVVWGTAKEDGQVPSTRDAKRMIEEAKSLIKPKDKP